MGKNLFMVIVVVTGLVAASFAYTESKNKEKKMKFEIVQASMEYNRNLDPKLKDDLLKIIDVNKKECVKSVLMDCESLILVSDLMLQNAKNAELFKSLNEMIESKVGE